jgi:hypothetical protein
VIEWRIDPANSGMTNSLAIIHSFYEHHSLVAALPE